MSSQCRIPGRRGNALRALPLVAGAKPGTAPAATKNARAAHSIVTEKMTVRATDRSVRATVCLPEGERSGPSGLVGHPKLWAVLRRAATVPSMSAAVLATVLWQCRTTPAHREKRRAAVLVATVAPFPPWAVNWGLLWV